MKTRYFFSMFCGIVFTLAGLHGNLLAQWTTSGSNIYNSNSGNVGIGLSNPGAKLEIVTGNTSPWSWTNSGWFKALKINDRNAFEFNAGTAVKFGIGATSSTQSLYFFTTTTEGTTQPATYRMVINANGNVGIGTGAAAPGIMLDVRGYLTLDAGSHARLYTGTGSTELNRYLLLYNSPTLTSASGLKAGGLLVADSYTYGNPGKNDVMVKGNVYVGTTTLSTAYRLSVNGSIRAKEVVVNSGWSDFVFADDYRLMPLHELEQRIKRDRHLPDIPPAEEVVKNGVGIGEIQTRLLQKIEELTLYVIEQNKAVERLQKENSEMKNRLANLEN